MVAKSYVYTSTLPFNSSVRRDRLALARKQRVKVDPAAAASTAAAAAAAAASTPTCARREVDQLAAARRELRDRDAAAAPDKVCDRAHLVGAHVHVLAALVHDAGQRAGRLERLQALDDLGGAQPELGRELLYV